MKVFSDRSILDERLSIIWKLENGVKEEGVGDGVYKDCLTQFWEEFYSQCTVGSDFKVPFLRHDFGAEELGAVARVYLAGWREFNYIPIAIAPVFMEEVIYGRSFSDLMGSFLAFVDPLERDILKKALADFDSVQPEELIDVLDQYSCRKITNKENLITIISELAHKEIIQTPMFVIDCWRSVLTPMAFHKHEELLASYKRLLPDTKKLLNVLRFPEDIRNTEEPVAGYLKRYVKGLDSNMLSRFLRFCTGSDLMLTDNITVQFTSHTGTGLGKRPIGHTCGAVLEVPKEYDNFPQFRHEFNNILNSNVWTMDLD
ncbi:hypothetical protein SNE40_001597 [Patella caerulea]